MQDIIKEAVERAEELVNQRNFQDAEAICKHVITLDENNIDAYNILALIYFINEDFESCKLNLEKLLTLIPDDIEISLNLSLVYEKLNQLKNALYLTEKLSKMNPNNSSIQNNLAYFYGKFGNNDKKLKILKNNIEKFNDDKSHFNLSNFYVEDGDFTNAIKHINKALKLNNNNPIYKFNKASCFLTKGLFKKGFELYENRWYINKVNPRNKLKILKKNDNIENKNILIYCEQGYGDLIQFIRFAKNLKSLNAKIYVECKDDLKSILMTFNYIDGFANENDDFLDYQCSVMSLPYILGISKKDIHGDPYLSVNKECLNHNEMNWDNYKKYFKIGISWAGSPYHPDDYHRSTYLKDFSILQRIPNVKLFSLQKDIRPRFIKKINKVIDYTDNSQNMSVVDMSFHMADWNHTASILEHLDLIISVDTALVHLAGSMGVPTWVLVHKPNDWRWLESGMKCIWYDSVSIFRQNKKDNWDHLFIEVEHALRNHVNAYQ